MPINILYLTPSVKLLGSRQSLLTMIRGLDRREFRPMVVGPYGGPLMEALAEEEVPTEIIRMRPWRKGTSWPFIPYALWQLFKLARQKKIDLIHANEFHINPYGVWAARWLKIPALCHHRADITKRQIRNYHLDWCQRIIAVSHEAARAFDFWPDKERRVTVLHNALDFEAFRRQGMAGGFRKEAGFSPQDLLVACVGQISEHKGQRVLLQAAPAVLKAHPTVHFLLAGNFHKPEIERELRQLVRDLGIEPRVHFLGFRADVAGIYADLDVLVLPSLREGFGRVSIEAMAFAKPVVASQVGGIPEVVEEGVSGWLFPSGDERALAQRLNQLLADSELRRSMGEAGCSWAETHFGIKAHIEELQKIYRQVLIEYKNKASGV